jgi:hypothetical protein
MLHKDVVEKEVVKEVVELGAAHDDGARSPHARRPRPAHADPTLEDELQAEIAVDRETIEAARAVRRAQEAAEEEERIHHERRLSLGLEVAEVPAELKVRPALRAFRQACSRR